ncbi:MAG: HAD-IA family hydrolase [Candidatus Thiodiazotropha sp. (ex Monitilora ramsayi)]|nr:HAD-IA family hydrolase [Candidatus Thiodiazotropha sp. (ex Monitilora ramsayi)]
MTSCVLFDLDGTFADTAPDLHIALNHLLSSHGRSGIDYADFRPSVSHGSKAMLKVGFGIEPDDPDFLPLQRQFLDLYQQDIAIHTRLFTGMDTLIEQLETKSIPWGIVTNKPTYLTDPLMQQLGLQNRASAIVSGDTTAFAKPHPEPILHACRLVKAEPSHSIYVGDAQRDIEAGRKAGARTLIARFGYLSVEDNPAEWQADGEINHPLDILAWL